jgi:RNA-directed DNA polymerase
VRDRAAQTLVRLALEPEWEARFEPNSFGFRPGSSAHDALEMLFTGICKKPKYVLDADIAVCFERIDHAALLAKLGTFPARRRAIRGWLTAGVLEGQQQFPTAAGTPQGGRYRRCWPSRAARPRDRQPGGLPARPVRDGPVRWGWQPLVCGTRLTS